MEIQFDNIASHVIAGFTPVQKEYLHGLLNGTMARLRPSSGTETQPTNTQESQPSVHGTPVDELCREELWKHEDDPLDIWEKLIAHAAENRAPEAADLFRFKFYGLFHVAPAQDSFMLRLRVPGGVITAHQMRGLAEIAEQWGAGRADLTTRANLQIRELAPRDILRTLKKLEQLGLTSRGSGADNIRNITATPTSGLDPDELLDVMPLAEALHDAILHTRQMYDLPRKFNVAFDSGGRISAVADTNDIGFTAVRVAAGHSVSPGIYFRVLLCGITGHRQFASDCGVLVKPEQAVAVAMALIRVYSEHGDRTDRRKARLKYLVDKWGVERFLAETEAKLGWPLLRAEIAVCEPRAAIDRTAHLGIHAQRQPGLHYVGVSVPVGRLPVEQMRAVADVAEQFGTGEIRLTVWQNLLLPNLATEHLDAALAALESAGLKWTAGAVLRGTVACTGNRGCRYAATDTKAHAVALATHLDTRFPILPPVNLHVTGCTHSCAQHYVGDIGLLGAKVNGAEGYQVVIGGGADSEQGLARELISAIALDELPATLERLFAAYLERRRDDEAFVEFSRRHTIDELHAFCADKDRVTQ